MSDIAISSGCFINHEEELENSGIKTVEISSHSLDTIGGIFDWVDRNRVRVLSIHAPCPGRGGELNLACKRDQCPVIANSIRESMEIAKRFEANYVVIHAFYCIACEFPANDIERMSVLRRLFANGGSIAEYIGSAEYRQAKTRTIENLKYIIPNLLRDFPAQRIVLENLNPRIGYGGLWIDDVVDIASAFGGDVGICLDLGHLTLAASALQRKIDNAICTARDLIWTTHIHQNFAGRFCIDRHWNESTARPGLQEVDTHLPFTSSFRPREQLLPLAISADNSAFSDILEGVAQFTNIEDGAKLEGSVEVELLLGMLSTSAHRIFEFDSRYAPLAEIIKEYHLGIQGNHPRDLW